MAAPDLTLVTEATLAATGFITGSGVPNGVVTAPPGAIYVDAAKTWDVLAWVKASGVGNTGWEVFRANATPRSIVALSTTAVTAGDIRYSRTTGGVTLTIAGLQPTADGTLTMFTNSAIVGIAPPPGGTVDFRVGVANGTDTRRAKIDQYGTLTIYAVKAIDLIYGSVHYNTSRAWAAPLGTVVVS